jgi:hypothetical protein
VLSSATEGRLSGAEHGRWLARKALDLFCYRSLWHVVPVRNDYSEGNGGSKDKKGKNKSDKDFHGSQPIGLWGLGRMTQIKFVLESVPRGSDSLYEDESRPF